eukprot:412113_1
MSSLVQKIKLRVTLNELSTHEFSQFLLNLLDTVGRDWIEHKILNGNSIDGVSDSDVSQIASNILQQRKKQCTEQDQKSTITIHALSTQLIGEIASYLIQSDYIQFEKANRSIFIGCNSPNTLHHLDLTSSTMNYPSVPFAKLLAIKSMTLPCCQFDQLQYPQDIRNSLEELQLTGLFKNADTDLKAFLKQTLFSFDHIKTLRWTINDQTYRGKSLCDVLCKFKGIECLEFNERNTDLQLRFLSDSHIRNCFPELLSFSWSGVSQRGFNFPNKIIELYHNQLRDLRLSGTAGIVIPSTSTFTNLQTLFLSKPKAAVVAEMCKANKLKEITIISPHKTGLTKMMCDLVQHNKMLQNLFVEMPSARQKIVFDGIEKGLFLTTKQKTGDIRIRVTIECEGTGVCMEDTTFHLSAIIQKLQFSKRNRFWVVCEFIGTSKPSQSDLACGVDLMHGSFGMCIDVTTKYNDHCATIALSKI